MIILYDQTKKTFFHQDETITTFAYGRSSFLLSSRNPKDCYLFKVNHETGARSIPLIGIVANKEGRNKYKGNFELFRAIQEDVERGGGMCFVFSPQDLFEDTIQGIMYNQPLNKWVKCFFPAPNVIYNRVSSRHVEKHTDYENLLSYIKRHKIPFFNPHFFNKWEIYKMLSNRSELLPYLPYTEQITREEAFIHFLLKYKKVYMLNMPFPLKVRAFG